MLCRIAAMRAASHEMFEMVMARVSAIACGHKDAIDLDRLRHDPLMKIAVGRCPTTGSPLASQSTISRLENAPSIRRRRGSAQFRLTRLECQRAAESPQFGRAIFPTLAGLVISRWRDRRLDSWVAGRGVWVAASAVEVGSEPLIGCAQARGRRAGEDDSWNPQSE
jgi:hypothetical protein